ncbi:MAG TPA: prepilin-type N-terminal cleavage/methylation domain-containing protein [Azospirillum sp.]|nr:prepilin-type N-terminal cleavage/methylation domain-containing protein [Azospirillum sp.]
MSPLPPDHRPLEHGPLEHGQAGFTLMEVLVAFAILAVALGALLPQLSLTLKSVGRLERRERAASIAEARLDALGTEVPVRPGEAEGTTEDGYTWRTVICCALPRNTVPNAVPLQLYQVALTVAWTEAGRPAELAVQTERLGWKE